MKRKVYPVVRGGGRIISPCIFVIGHQILLCQACHMTKKVGWDVPYNPDYIQLLSLQGKLHSKCSISGDFPTLGLFQQCYWCEDCFIWTIKSCSFLKKSKPDVRSGDISSPPYPIQGIHLAASLQVSLASPIQFEVLSHPPMSKK